MIHKNRMGKVFALPESGDEPLDRFEGLAFDSACEVSPSEEGMSRLDEGVPVPYQMRVEQCWSMRWMRQVYFAISGQLLDLAHVKESEIPGVDCADPDLW